MAQGQRQGSCDGPNGCRHTEVISRKAAEKAVKDVFYLMGVDVTDAESIANFQESLRFSEKFRSLSEHGVKTIVGAVCLGLVTALVTLISSRFGG